MEYEIPCGVTRAFSSNLRVEITLKSGREEKWKWNVKLGKVFCPKSKVEEK